MSHRGKHQSAREEHSSHSAQEPAPSPAAAPADEFPSEHRKGLLPELYFRWRGGEITRLEAFCDVVFGFALTLLVVSLEVPHNYKELIAVMRGFLPFAVCFAQLILIWRTHYVFSRRYGLEDPYTVFLNVVLLFLVLFYVYPLKFVFTLVFSQLTGGEALQPMSVHEASMLMRIYAGGFAAVFLLFGLMYAHAYRLRGPLGLNEAEALQTRAEISSNAILVATGVISFLLAILHPEWAGWWFFVIGPVLAVNGAIYGKRIRLLSEGAHRK